MGALLHTLGLSGLAGDKRTSDLMAADASCYYEARLQLVILADKFTRSL